MNFWRVPVIRVLITVAIMICLIAVPFTWWPRPDDQILAETLFYYVGTALSGIILGFTSLLLLATVVMKFGRKIFGIPRVGGKSAAALTYAATRRWTLQSPMAGLCSPSLTFGAYEQPKPGDRRRYLLSLASIHGASFVTGLVAAGVALVLGIDNPWMLTLWCAAVFLTCSCIGELVPIRSEDYVSVGGVLSWLLAEPDAFLPFVARNMIGAFEFASSKRPGELHIDPKTALENIDLLQVSTENRLMELRMVYLFAIDRSDYDLASRAIHRIGPMYQNEALWQGNRDAIALLMAFHAAWIDHSWPIAQSWLDSTSKSKALARTPLYLLVGALISWLQGDSNTTVKRIRRADKRLRGFKVISGTTAVWLDIVDYCMTSLPPELKATPRRRRTVKLIPVPQQVTKPAAELVPDDLMAA